MSRVGNLPIPLLEGVNISIDGDNVVTVKGPKGELVQQVDPAISIEIGESEVVVSRASEQKDHKAKHGLYRSLLNNMIEGVVKGHQYTLELVGVGYRANNNGQLLELVLGYSHGITFEIPAEVKVTTASERGQNPTITLESFDKQLIGQVAAKIRSLRKPEPYKGKGIRFQGEHIRRKAGKSAATA